MSHALTDFGSGVLICTPDTDLSDGGAALNSNFIALANLLGTCVRNPPAGSVIAAGLNASGVNIVSRIAAHFVGSTYITAADFMPTGNDPVPWSVSFWVRTTSTNPYNPVATWGTMVAYEGMTPVISSLWGAHPQFAMNVPSTNAFYGSTSGALNDGNWHLCVAAYDGTNLFLYVDNVAQTVTQAGSGPDWRSHLNITNSGAGTEIGHSLNTPDASYRFFNGDLAEIYFWSGALSAADAAWLWNGGAGQPQPTAAAIAAAITDCTLKAGYHFANNLNDFSGNGYTGSPVSGGPSYVIGTALAVSQGSTSLDGGTILTNGSGRIRCSALPTGTPGSLPTGLSAGDLWIDVTDGTNLGKVRVY